MKRILGSLTVSLFFALAFSLALSVLPKPAHAGPYFQTLLKDPTHPKISVSAIYTPALVFDGMITDVAVVYHKADRNNTLWPQKALDMGLEPLSWTLLEIGFGGNSDSGFVSAGISVNAAPTLLGPLVKALSSIGGKAAAFGALIIDKDGNGVKLSLRWKADLIKTGGLTNLNDLSFPPRYGFGYTFAF